MVNVVTEQKTYVTWDECVKRAFHIVTRGQNNYGTNAKAWGIPRGGNYVASILAGIGVSIVDSPENADYAVDDIVDSGRTAKRVKDEFNLETFALYDRRFTGTNFIATDETPKGWIVFPWESSFEADQEDLITRMIEMIGDDPKRDGLIETPSRVAKAWDELYAGYHNKEPKLKLFNVWDDVNINIAELKPIQVNDIKFVSTCEHHMMPFWGTVDVTYRPYLSNKGDNIRVVGLSKIPRLVSYFASRLQIQERLGQQICDAIAKQSSAVRVKITAQHMCVSARGHHDDGVVMTTESVYNSQLL